MINVPESVPSIGSFCCTFNSRHNYGYLVLRKYTFETASFGFNDLAYKRPELASEWDYEKNKGKKPSEVTEFSTSSVWWICPKGHDSYRMSVAHRSRGRGCRLCKAEKVSEQFSKQVLQFSKDGEFIETFKSATEAGKKIGVSTSAIANACRGKSKTCAGYIFKYKVWWQCKNGHEWQAAVYSRNAGNGCPFCASKKTRTS